MEENVLIAFGLTAFAGLATGIGSLLALTTHHTNKKFPGCDAIFIGPYDLSASLGQMGQLTAPEVQQAIETIAQTCHAAGVRLGIFAATVEDIEPFIEQNYTLLAIGTDGLLMAQKAKEILQTLDR